MKKLKKNSIYSLVAALSFAITLFLFIFTTFRLCTTISKLESEPTQSELSRSTQFVNIPGCDEFFYNKDTNKVYVLRDKSNYAELSPLYIESEECFYNEEENIVYVGEKNYINSIY